MSYQPQTEAATSRFLNVEENGETLRIHFNDCGQGDETVVLLHGSGPGATGWANFSRNIDPLVEAGYRVILLDCPGWGKSDSIVNRGSRSDLNARVLKSVIDQLDQKIYCIQTRSQHLRVKFVEMDFVACKINNSERLISRHAGPRRNRPA